MNFFFGKLYFIQLKFEKILGLLCLCVGKICQKAAFGFINNHWILKKAEKRYGEDKQFATVNKTSTKR